MNRMRRRMARGLVLGLFLLLVVGLAPAARADPPVSRMALMAFGSFNGPDGLNSFGVQVACTSFDGCVGLAGFPFPGFVLREHIAGSFSCTPADDPVQCVVTIASPDIACTLTTAAVATPGLSNPVHIDCTAPEGSGDGLTTLNLLLGGS